MVESKAPGIFAFDMQAKAEEQPDFPIITFECHPYPDEILTYSDLVAKGDKLARALQQAGIGPGDAIAVVMRNHPEFVIGMYAATALRAVLVAIDPRSKGDKLKFQLQDSGARAVIFAAEVIPQLQEALTDLPHIKPIGVMYRGESNAKVSSNYPDLDEILNGPAVAAIDPDGHDPEDFFLLIYTSGTTGNPKGIKMRSNRIGMFALLAQLIWEYTPADKLYTGLSMAHLNALSVTLFPSLYMGIPAVISRKFTKSRIWDICRQYGCTIFSLLGGMMTGIFAEPPCPNDRNNPVRKVLSAGTPFGIWTAFEKRFDLKIHEWYGAAEGGFAHNPPGIGPIGSFGKPLDGFLEMRVVREDDTECEPYERGEIVSRLIGGKTEVVYHGNQEASESKTRGGWLRSGDIAHRDEDGWFYFDFRKGGGLRRQGDFIMPEYVEGVLAEHPDVTDVCVYGIDALSGAPGESDLVAAVVAAEGRRPDIKDLFDTCRNKLEPNSVPSFIQVVAEIPKTISEKKLDRLLREQFDPNNPDVHRLGSK